MKKGTKVFALFLFSIVALSFLVNVVSAAFIIKDNFVSTFSNLFSGNINSFQGFLQSLLVPEILFGLLIFLVIFAIISKISLFGPDWIKVSVSVIVAILAGGFIDIQVLLPILNQYSAMGILISFYLPFILIFYFLREIAPNNFLVAKLVWWSYAVIMFINAFINKSQLDPITTWLYWIIIIAAVVMAIIWAQIMKRLLISEIESALAESSQMNKVMAAQEIDQLEKSLTVLAGIPPAQRMAIEKHIKQLRANLDRQL